MSCSNDDLLNPLICYYYYYYYITLQLYIFLYYIYNCFLTLCNMRRRSVWENCVKGVKWKPSDNESAATSTEDPTHYKQHTLSCSSLRCSFSYVCLISKSLEASNLAAEMMSEVNPSNSDSCFYNTDKCSGRSNNK